MSNEFGMRLYYLRAHKTGFSQQQVADKLGMERSTYSKYETGVTEPSIAALIKLRHIFNVSYEELFETKLDEARIADYEVFRMKRK